MPNAEPVRVTITIEATPRTEHHEIDRAEWDVMTPADRRALLDEMAQDALNNPGGYRHDAA